MFERGGLSVRIDKSQLALASTGAQLAALDAQRTAEQREMVTMQTVMKARLAGKDKDEVITALQQQIAELPNDPETPAEDNTNGV